MAKQAGIIKLKGTIDDISFYRTADGHMARAKGGISRQRILNDPAFQRTRENGSEFGTAGKGGKLIRNALRSLMQHAKDRLVVGRLTKVLLSIIKTDATNERGLRTIESGNMDLLLGFNFNGTAPLGTTLYAAFDALFDRVTGEATIDLEAYSPMVRIAAPAGTTHYRISLGAAELDFPNMQFDFSTSNSGIQAYDPVEVPASSLTVTLTPASALPVVQVVGIEFFQLVNGEYYPLKNGANNALAVVGVDNI